MRCYICDRVLSEPQYDRDYESFDPCKECLEAVEDTLATFRDRPSMDEDEPGFDQLILPLDDKIILDNSVE